MMRTLLLLVCMVLGSTFELTGALQTTCRSRSADAMATELATARVGGACTLERGCARMDAADSGCDTARSRGEWHCGCCRTKTPVAITLLRVAPLPVCSCIMPPAVQRAAWPAARIAPCAHVPVLDSPPPRA